MKKCFHILPVSFHLDQSPHEFRSEMGKIERGERHGGSNEERGNGRRVMGNE